MSSESVESFRDISGGTREREREREEREERQLQVSTKENFIGSSKKSLLHRFRSHYAVINAGERRGRMVRK